MSTKWTDLSQTLVKRMEEKGASSMFSPEVVGLLVDMKTCAQDVFAEFQAALRKHKILTEIKDAMKEARQKLRDVHTEEEQNADARPHIMVTAELKQMVDEAIAAIATNTDIYQRGGDLVRVVRHASPGDADDAPTSQPVIAKLGENAMRELLSDVAYFKHRAGERDDGTPVFRQVLPPDPVVRALLARGTFDGIRPLTAVVEWPTISADGEIIADNGYNPDTGVLTVLNAPAPVVPETPTRDDAWRAVGVLFEAVCDFPFESPTHMVAWFAALLTLIVRFAIDGDVPMLLLDGNSPGSGKSKLADLLWVILTGSRMPRRPYVPDEGKMMSTVTSVVVTGLLSVLFDNIAGVLGGAALDAALTGGFWQDRLFGRNDITISAKIHTVWMASGNNLTLGGDLHRRVLPCRLRTEEEKPELRENFTHANLLKWARQQRSQLLGAALTILRAYQVAGRPQVRMKPWGSFEAWSEAVRAPLLWLGLPDPADTREGLRDDARSKLAALLVGWLKAFGLDTPLTVHEVVERIVTAETEREDAYRDKRHPIDFFRRGNADRALEQLKPLAAALADISGRNVEQKGLISLGMKLKQFHQKNCNGLMLVQGTRHNTATWSLQRAGDPSGGSTSSPTENSSSASADMQTTGGPGDLSNSLQGVENENINTNNIFTSHATANDSKGSTTPPVPCERPATEQETKSGPADDGTYEENNV